MKKLYKICWSYSSFKINIFGSENLCDGNKILGFPCHFIIASQHGRDLVWDVDGRCTNWNRTTALLATKFCFSFHTSCYNSCVTYLVISFYNGQNASCNAFFKCRTCPSLQRKRAKATPHNFTDDPINSPVHKFVSDSLYHKSNWNKRYK